MFFPLLVLGVMAGFGLFAGSALAEPAGAEGWLRSYLGDGSSNPTLFAQDDNYGAIIEWDGSTVPWPASFFSDSGLNFYTVSGGATSTGATGTVVTAGNALTAWAYQNPATPTPVAFSSTVEAYYSQTMISGAGSFTPGGGPGGGFGGSLSVGTTVFVSSFLFVGIWVPLTLTLPLGVVGATTTTLVYTVSPFMITIHAAKWTTGAISDSATNLTAAGGVTTTSYTAAGSHHLTHSFGGLATLVTPFRVTINTAGSTTTRLGYSTMTIAFETNYPVPLPTPESGTLLLLGAGAAGLALGRRRRTSQGTVASPLSR